MSKIRLWNPPPVRASYIFVDEDGQVEEEGAPLSAEEVCCDICNADVVVRPVPVVGTYALCLKCLSTVIPEWPLEVNDETKREWEKQLLSLLTSFDE